MKKINLLRFTQVLKPNDYESWTKNPSSFETEETGDQIDIDIFIKKLNKVKNSQYVNKAATDIELVESAHKTFKHLPSNILTDIRMWQWVSLKPFFDYSEWRWNISDEAVQEQPTLRKRMFSGMGIDGLSRNSISRLVIPCIDLVDNNDYSLVKILYQSQQAEASIMQSRQSMNKDAFRAMVRSVEGLVDNDLKERIKRANALASIYTFSAMTEDQIFKIIHQP